MAAGGVMTGGHGHSHSDQHPEGCCPGEGNKSDAQKLPSIFDVIKSGMLVPVQAVIEAKGPEVLKSRDNNGHTPAHWACLGGHTTILRYILENKGPVDLPSESELGQHPIHWACVNGHIAVVDILLKSGASIDVVDSKGCTPLIVACQYGKTMLAGYLLGRGARIHMVDKDGDTALHWAAFKGFNELMRLLIYSGFNARQTDNFGQTPLHLACISGNLTSVQDLCEQDEAEIDLRDKNGKTPLMLAMGRKHDKIVHYLKKQSKLKSSIVPRLDFWSIVFGPPGNSKAPLLFFIVNVIFWGYPMYIFKCIPMTWNELEMLHIFFIFMNIVMWVSLYHANSVDPGFLPRNIPEYDEAIKQMAHYDEWKQGRNPLKRLCHTCRSIRPVRSKHCRVCNRCVKMFDHHCPYIYNCVGYNNRVWFYTFVMCFGVMCVSTNYFCIYMLRTAGWDWSVVIGLVETMFFTVVAAVVFGCTVEKVGVPLLTIMIRKSNWVSFTFYVVSFLLCDLMGLYMALQLWAVDWWLPRTAYLASAVPAMFFLIMNIILLIQVIYHISLNLTTNERINRKRYDYLKDGKGNYYNPFNRGIVNNALEFFYLKRQLGEDDVQFLNVTTV